MCYADGWMDIPTTALPIRLQQLKLKIRATCLIITPQSVLLIVHFCISFVVHGSWDLVLLTSLRDFFYCEICTFLSLHNIVLRTVTPYRLLGGNRCFGGARIFTVHVEVK